MVNWADATVRFSKLLVIASLAGCGAPGADQVFTKGNPKIPAAPDTTKAVAANPAPRMQLKQYSGYYVRIDSDSRFQPCGTSTPLEITGTAVGRALLRERFRWMAVETGRRMFAVFQGAILTDTIKPQGSADSAAGTARTRFFITGVDSLRTLLAGDCGGMKIR